MRRVLAGFLVGQLFGILLFILLACLACGQDPSGLDLPVERPTRAAPARARNPSTCAPLSPPPDPPPEDRDVDSPKFYGAEVKSENATIFYVVDVSGSMAYDVADYLSADGSLKKGNRLDRAKAELVKSISCLPENFKFNILAYDCSAYQWQPDLVPADAARKADAICWVETLEALGGTGTGGATALALGTKGLKLVILLTDGAPNCHLNDACGSWMDFEGHRKLIRNANLNPAIVNVYGIGAFGPFRKFCGDVASDNGGTYTDVR